MQGEVHSSVQKIKQHEKHDNISRLGTNQVETKNREEERETTKGRKKKFRMLRQKRKWGVYGGGGTLEQGGNQRSEKN